MRTVKDWKELPNLSKLKWGQDWTYSYWEGNYYIDIRKDSVLHEQVNRFPVPSWLHSILGGEYRRGAEDKARHIRAIIGI
jgi:hypothetical protein